MPYKTKAKSFPDKYHEGVDFIGLPQEHQNNTVYKHVNFINFDGSHLDFTKANFIKSTFFSKKKYLSYLKSHTDIAPNFKKHLNKYKFGINFKNADLSGVQNLHTTNGLENAIFNDNTIIDNINLEKIAQVDPIIAQKLRTIRYLGRLRRHPIKKFIYWPWKIFCNCGRSWLIPLFWIFFFVLLFSYFYFLGAKNVCSPFPHISISKDPSTFRPFLNFRQCLHFSTLTFICYNVPNTSWDSFKTGIWIILETWLGISMFTTMLTVLASKIIKND